MTSESQHLIVSSITVPQVRMLSAVHGYIINQQPNYRLIQRNKYDIWYKLGCNLRAVNDCLIFIIKTASSIMIIISTSG